MNDSLDTIRSGEPDVIVIGAGIAGLSAALTATRAGHRTLVLDAHTAGGRARTMHLDGFAQTSARTLCTAAGTCTICWPATPSPCPAASPTPHACGCCATVC